MIFPIFTLACCVQHPSVSTAEFHPLPGQGAATPGDQLQSSHRVLAEHESCVSTRAAIWASMVPHEPHLPKSPNMRVYPWNTRPRQGSRDGAEPRGEARGAQRLNEPGTGGTGTGEAVPNKAGKCCPRARLLGRLCLAPVPTASTASVRRVPDGTDNFQAHRQQPGVPVGHRPALPALLRVLPPALQLHLMPQALLMPRAAAQQRRFHPAGRSVG